MSKEKGDFSCVEQSKLLRKPEFNLGTVTK